jgi:DNA helicase-2/ATP-dependent DNA helicase PcrA
MTIHAAKGCEYPAVFLTGLEQGLFPLSMDEEAKKEEERRLFYVGITRAKKRLFITHANSRWRFKDREQALPSEFFRELPKECIQYVNPTAQARQKVYTFDDDAPAQRPIMSNYGKPTGSSFAQPKVNPYASNTASKQTAAPKSSPQPTSSRYSVGDRVKHNRYGEGTIKEIKSTGSVTVLVIAFDDVGIKQFDASLAVLKVL